MILLLAACFQQHEGTAVGNPGKLGLSAETEGTDLTLARAEAEVGSVEIVRCDAEDESLPVDDVLDLLAPETHALPLPGGALCGLELVFPSPMSVGGSTSSGTEFSVALDPGALFFSTRYDVDGDALLVSLPIASLLDAAELDARGDGASVAADDPSAVEWAEDVAERSALYDDLDGDALTDDDPVLAVAGDSFGAPSAGCGCGGSANPGWIALLLAAWGGRVYRNKNFPRKRA